MKALLASQILLSALESAEGGPIVRGMSDG